MSESRTAPTGGDRLAKVIARSGLCSRRDAEAWITAGRVVVNGKTVKTPAFNVTDRDRIVVDGVPLAERQGTRVWLYHKPAGLVVTEKDPEGRPTVFETVEKLGLPRVVSIGRLDINTEGLLLLTNDGGLKRVLELPATGWLRKYRVRAFGSVTQAALDKLKDGIEIDGVRYGSIEAKLESERGSNVWLELALREGKNREVKNVLGALGLQVNRLIRISYGPFQLADIPIGGIETVKARVLRDQLGRRLAEEADVDFDSDLPEPVIGVPLRDRETGRGTNTVQIAQQRFRFTDRPERDPGANRDEDTGPRHRPGRFDQGGRRPAPRREERAEDTGPTRHIHFDDGREAQEFRQKSYGKEKNTRTGETTDARGAGGGKGGFGDKKPFGDKGGKPFEGKKSFGDKKPYGDKPAGRSFGDKPAGAKPYGARSDAPRPGRNFDERPKRDFDDRPKRDFADRPRRDDGERGYTPRADAPPRGDRPAKAYGPKPRGTFDNKPKSFRDRPERPRSADTGAGRPSFSDRPQRDFGDSAPRGGERKPGGERAKRAEGSRPSFGDKPGGFAPRPRGSGPDGDRPRRPRPEGDSARPAGGASKPYVKRDAGSAPSRGPRGAGGPAGNRGPRPGGGSGGRPSGGSGRPGGGSGRPGGKGRPPGTRG